MGQGTNQQGIRYTKLILVTLALIATYVGWFMGKDPSQLAIIVPSLFGMYVIGNVGVEYVRNKYGNNGTSSSPDSGG